jgi:PAS domain S-box-containing protein
VLGCIVLNLAVDGALGLALRQSRNHYEESARINVSNLSKVLEQNVLTLIKEIDLTLKTVADEGTRVDAITRPGNHLFVEFLDKHSARIPDILGLRVLDRTGNIIYSTKEVMNTRVNEADREHFIRVRDDPNAALVITGPILGRASHKWVLIFSRRMSRPDGSFSAEVHASVTTNTLTDMFSAVDIGSHGVVSMWDKTTTLARYPAKVGGKSAIGTMNPSPQLKALLDAETKAAFYTAIAPTDNVKKSYAIRKVGQFPLWVLAGTAEIDYLAPWKTQAWQTALAALLFAVITLIIAWQIYRYWRIGNLARESEEQLNSAQALAHIGSWLKDPHSGEYVWSDEVFRIFGYTPQSLTPDDGLLLAAVHPDDKHGVKKVLADLIQGKGNSSIDCRIVRTDGSVRWVHIEGRAEPGTAGIADRISGFIRDISESKRADEALQRNADRVQALLNLNQMTDSTLQQVIGYALEEIVRLTQSKLGYIAFFNDDETILTMHSWSKQEMQECAISDKPIHYTVKEIGLWGEVVRQRRAVITNDYTAAIPWKKGYPDGHVTVLRHMSVPVFAGQHIVLVAGVGNKEVEYDENDVQELTLLMDGMWRLTERKQAEEQIVRSLQEKEVLLKEIHHRVKNNMQVICSLLSLQANGITDETVRAKFEESRNQVYTMALIHESLYSSSDLAHIDFKVYLKSLIGGIVDTYKRNDVIVSVDMESIALDVTVGIPCGLLVNELVSNSLKYAFPEGRNGTIRVGIYRNGEGNNVLFVEDNGIGLPDEVDFFKTQSLGLQLVNALTKQIHGTIELSRTEGTRVSITFPYEEDKMGVKHG